MAFECGLALGAIRYGPQTGRAFLSAKNVGTRTRGPAAIWSRYDRFGTQLPRFAEKLELEPGEIRGFDFLRAYLQIVAEWIKADATRDRRR